MKRRVKNYLKETPKPGSFKPSSSGGYLVNQERIKKRPKVRKVPPTTEGTSRDTCQFKAKGKKTRRRWKNRKEKEIRG